MTPVTRGGSAQHGLWLCDNRGRHVLPVPDYFSAAQTRAVNGVGTLALTMPVSYYDAVDPRLWPILEHTRKLPGRAAHDTMAYFIRWRVYEVSEAGRESLTVGGVDLNALLRTRIIAYGANTANTDKTDQADDLLKAFVKEQLDTSATDTARRISSYGYSTDADIALGVSQSKVATRRELLKVLQEIAEAAIIDGTNVYFGMRVTGLDPLTFAFTTRTGQWGINRTAGRAGELVLSPEAGTLRGVALREDYTGEATYVYAAGAGTEDTRLVQGVEDTTRSGLSPWARQEVLYSNPRITTTAGLTDAGNMRLSAGRPRVSFEGQIAETDNCRYGEHWDLGDYVVAKVKTYSFSVRLNTVRLRFTRLREQIECKLVAVMPQGVGGAAGGGST